MAAVAAGLTVLVSLLSLGRRLRLDGGSSLRRFDASLPSERLVTFVAVLLSGVDVLSEPESHLLRVPFLTRTVFQPSVTELWCLTVQEVI